MEVENNFVNFDGSFNSNNLTILLQKYLSNKYFVENSNSWTYHKVSGGYSNTLIKAINVLTNKTFLIRLFGSYISSPEIINKINLINIYLGENQMGPKLYGVFSKGTIEEFLPGRCLTRKELHSYNITAQIGYHMGQIHKLELPFVKTPTFWDDVEEWLDKLQKEEEKLLQFYDKSENRCDDETLSQKIGFKVKRIEESESSFLQIFIQPVLFSSTKATPETTSIKELRKEFELILSKMNKSKSPIVFCHNDLHEGNIMYDEDKNTILPIDYEYSSYNYRGFDFAQTLNHYAWEYAATNKYGYNIFLDEYPNTEQLEIFFKNYKKTNNTTSIVEELINESILFKEIPHFVWCIWGLEKHFSLLCEQKTELSYVSSSFDRLSLYYYYKNS
uniref:Kinase-like protein n=1 Tax=Strongyloides venezuelensis TaxID=75913 RepID=A0A0K0FUF2_STRVS